MKRILPILLFGFLMSSAMYAQRVENFELNDILTGGSFELAGHGDQKAIVVIFTSLNCPFSKLYEERIVSLHKQFSDQGVKIILVNPHYGLEEGESQDEHKERASAKGIELAFLDDSQKEVTRMFSATKLPEAVVVTPSQTGFSIVYRGAIDNNPQVASNANMKYLENALTAILNRRNPSPASSRPVGCNIKMDLR
jgi:peroxiredoxin